MGPLLGQPQFVLRGKKDVSTGSRPPREPGRPVLAPIVLMRCDENALLQPRRSGVQLLMGGSELRPQVGCRLRVLLQQFL